MCGMARESSLSGDEQLVLLLHPHWKTLIRPVLIAVLVVTIASTISALVVLRKLNQLDLVSALKAPE